MCAHIRYAIIKKLKENAFKMMKKRKKMRTMHTLLLKMEGGNEVMNIKCIYTYFFLFNSSFAFLLFMNRGRLKSFAFMKN